MSSTHETRLDRELPTDKARGLPASLTSLRSPQALIPAVPAVLIWSLEATDQICLIPC
jgi:hypothetical protein